MIKLLAVLPTGVTFSRQISSTIPLFLHLICKMAKQSLIVSIPEVCNIYGVFLGERKNTNINANVCHLLTVGGHEETGVDLFGVTKVWLNLLSAGIKLPLMDKAGFDVQHIETDLLMTVGKKQEKQSAVCDPSVFTFHLYKI